MTSDPADTDKRPDVGTNHETLKPAEPTTQDDGQTDDASDIDKDDPRKVEKLSKLGHADDEVAEGTE